MKRARRHRRRNRFARVAWFHRCASVLQHDRFGLPPVYQEQTNSVQVDARQQAVDVANRISGGAPRGAGNPLSCYCASGEPPQTFL